jgi:hypothetical protein
MSTRVAGLLTGLGLLLPIGSPCAAQAWLPPAGELSAAATVQRVDAQGHYLDDGSRLPGYSSRAVNLLLDLSYGITDRLSVGLRLPFVNVKYIGPEEPLNLPDNKLDDGAYHGTLSDVHVEIRGDVLDHPLAVTPFFAASIPSHGYPTLGEAAAGRGFQEFEFGVYAGHVFDEVLPGAFVHGAYSYAMVRQDLDIPLDHSNLELSAGYEIAQTVQVSVLWRRQWVHGGLTFDQLYAAPPDVFRNLDRVVHENFQHLGVAVGFPVTESIAAHANFVKFVSGVDAHFGYGISGGLSWTWQLHREQDPFAARAFARPGSAMRR